MGARTRTSSAESETSPLDPPAAAASGASRAGGAGADATGAASAGAGCATGAAAGPAAAATGPVEPLLRVMKSSTSPYLSESSRTSSLRFTQSMMALSSLMSGGLSGISCSLVDADADVSGAEFATAGRGRARQCANQVEDRPGDVVGVAAPFDGGSHLVHLRTREHRAQQDGVDVLVWMLGAEVVEHRRDECGRLERDVRGSVPQYLFENLGMDVGEQRAEVAASVLL